MILSSCSDFFNALFKQTMSDTPYFILTDIQNKHIEYLLDYMYKGEIKVAQCEIRPLLLTAQYLQIKGLCYDFKSTDEKLDKNTSLFKSYEGDTFSPPRKRKKTLEDLPFICNKGNHDGFNEIENYSQNNSNVLPLNFTSKVTDHKGFNDIQDLPLQCQKATDGQVKGTNEVGEQSDKINASAKDLKPPLGLTPKDVRLTLCIYL
ncbi:UNVERIFIED_CONTAM: hypothetical protein GTU68_065500 [Idotea baltica]|nr:hypothetical protein [Idotea baltica]